MVVVVMVMTMGLPLLPAVDQDGHVGTGDALAAGRLGPDLHTGEEGVHICQELGPVRLGAQLVEGRHEHVPRRAHGALQV